MADNGTFKLIDARSVTCTTLTKYIILLYCTGISLHVHSLIDDIIIITIILRKELVPFAYSLFFHLYETPDNSTSMNNHSHFNLLIILPGEPNNHKLHSDMLWLSFRLLCWSYVAFAQVNYTQHFTIHLTWCLMI